MSVPSLFGLETEYAFTTFGARGGSQHRDEQLVRLMLLARKTLPHLADVHGNGIYLQNGSRFYVDAGSHPELCTPECLDPWEVVRYRIAGERILAQLATELEQTTDLGEVGFFKCNVDYSGSRSTWGCHESYLCRADPKSIAKEIIPHLVSRVVYTGAGGFNNRSKNLEFLLSPRAPHLQNVATAASTSVRGIFHTKNEPLCANGFGRLHLICGESLCSERATFLKVGTTALVVRLIEAGLCDGKAMELHSPILALHRFARDPRCRELVPLRSGARLGAIAIQRHYLEAAERQVGQSFMPPWAGAVCQEWREMLDRLEGAPDSVSTILDWAMKLAMFRERTRRRGLDWEALSCWARLGPLLSAGRARLDPGRRPLAQRLLDPDRGLRDRLETLRPYLSWLGLSWEGFSAYLELRSELLEIDTRFGELGERGIFRNLDATGVLSHALDGLGDVAPALREPPEGRASVRGRTIRKLAKNSERYRCTWDGIVDTREHRLFDLSDPFGKGTQWRKRPREERSSGRLTERLMRLRDDTIPF